MDGDAGRPAADEIAECHFSFLWVLARLARSTLRLTAMELGAATGAGYSEKPPLRTADVPRIVEVDAVESDSRYCAERDVTMPRASISCFASARMRPTLTASAASSKASAIS